MYIEQQALDLVKENEALRRINQGLTDAVNQSDDNGKAVDLVWLTRDELKEYSDINQAGGVNAIKADAIGMAAERFRYDFEGSRDTDSIEAFFDGIADELRAK